MRRRDFISLVGGASAAWPLIARAQQAALPVVGFLHAASADGYSGEVEAFQQGLREVGYNAGQNVAIEYRWADGQYDRLPGLAADLVRRQATVIVAAPIPSAVAAKQATATIPIVFELGGDPVRLGLVTSLNRPGGNITGIVNLSATLLPKRVELVHELVPSAGLIAVLLNPGNPNLQNLMNDVRDAEKLLGVTIEFIEAHNANEIEEAFTKIHDLRAGALVIGPDPFFNIKAAEFAELATRYGVPASHELREFRAAGGLMSYQADLLNAYHLAGVYAGRVLRGEKPADLPVQQATKVQLVINLKAAKALGLSVPLPLLGRADEVIE